MDYEFTESKIDQDVEVVRVGIQPPIDAKADRIHLQEFYNRVSEKQPHLFGTLTQAPNVFEIKKQLSVSGGGRVEIATFFWTPQGPTLSFPRKLPFMDDELPWAQDLTKEILDCLDTLQACHPARRVFRATKRREIVLSTGTIDSGEVIRARFATGLPENTQNVAVRWTDTDDMYDRKISLAALQKRNVVVQNVGGIEFQRQEPTEEFGIRMTLEVTNARTAKALEREDLKIILDHADTYYNETVWRILKGASNVDTK
ncbi:MAG TPA: hypothetical protein VM487_16020 [Phycisphaerae bacterium]|nr:hypothetical protein [Phycisphaerae bacterium]